MTSEIRTNSLKSRAGLSTVTMTDSGPMFSGITTFVDNSTFSVGTGGTIHAPATNTLNIGVNNTESLRIDSNSNLKVAGIVTATSFVGDGSALTNLPSSTSDKIEEGNSKVEVVDTGTGSITFVLDGTEKLNMGSYAQFNQLVYVNDTVQVGGQLQVTDAILHMGNTGTRIRFPTNDVIQFNTNNAERLRIDSSGHMGLGVTPNANWPTNNDFKALQIGTGACVFGRGSGDEDRGGIAVNWYSDGSNNKYIGNGNAARIYLADGNIIFSTAGANSSGANASMTLNERLRIDSSGHMGLGVNNPTKRLTVQAGSNNADIALFTGNDLNRGLVISTESANSQNDMGVVYHAHGQHSGSYLGEHIFKTNNTERLRILSNSQIRHTRSDNTGRYDLEFRQTGGLSNGNYGGIHWTQNSSGTTNLAAMKIAYQDSGQPDFVFYTRQTGGNSMEESVRFTHEGDICLNQNTNDTRLGIKARSSAVEFITCRDSSSTLKFYIHSSGNTYNTNGNYSQISDQSLKENIVDAKSQWNDIKNIKIRNFNFTEASGLDTHTQIGCVAQEVETVSPKLVSAPKDGVKTVANSVLYMKAVKALQEAMTRIETLEQDNIALRARVTNLEGN